MFLPPLFRVMPRAVLSTSHNLSNLSEVFFVCCQKSPLECPIFSQKRRQYAHSERGVHGVRGDLRTEMQVLCGF